MTDKQTRDYEKFLQRTPKKKEKPPEPIPQYENENSEENFENEVYKEISLLNGQINRMNLGELKNACKSLHLDCYGKRDPLKRRLKEHYKMEKLVQAGLMEPRANPNADYFLIIDFEATCEEKNPPGYPHEVIEFPVILVSSGEHGKEPERVDVFHSFVRPVINPKLSEFCKSLTGIEQETVDKAEVFQDVLIRFESWMKSHGLGITKTFILITDGPFDMGRFMYLQCKYSEISYPEYGMYWANLRKLFVNFYKASFYSNNNHAAQLPGLQTMLSRLGMEFEGQPHSGLDDAKNIARIVVRLLKDKAVIRVNEKIHKVPQGVDDSNRCNGKLFSVVPVNRKDSESWIKSQKKRILSNTAEKPSL